MVVLLVVALSVVVVLLVVVLSVVVVRGVVLLVVGGTHQTVLDLGVVEDGFHQTLGVVVVGLVVVR